MHEIVNVFILASPSVSLFDSKQINNSKNRKSHKLDINYLIKLHIPTSTNTTNFIISHCPTLIIFKITSKTLSINNVPFNFLS